MQCCCQHLLFYGHEMPPKALPRSTSKVRVLLVRSPGGCIAVPSRFHKTERHDCESDNHYPGHFVLQIARRVSEPRKTLLVTTRHRNGRAGPGRRVVRWLLKTIPSDGSPYPGSIRVVQNRVTAATCGTHILGKPLRNCQRRSRSDPLAARGYSKSGQVRESTIAARQLQPRVCPNTDLS